MPRSPTSSSSLPARLQRPLEVALALTAALSLASAALTWGDGAPSALKVVIAAALLGVVALLRAGMHPSGAAKPLLLAGVLVPVLLYQVASVVSTPQELGAEGGYSLLLLSFRVTVGVAAAASVVLPPGWSSAVGVVFLGLTTGVVALLYGVPSGSFGVDLLVTVMTGLIVVALLQVLARTSSLLATRSVTSAQALEDRRRLQAMAAHDLRSPLATATGALQTVAMHRDRLDAPTLEDLLRVADDGVRRAAALSDDLLEEAMGPVAQGPATTLVVGDLVERAVAVSRLPEGSVQVRGGDAVVTAVPDRLERIVVNLLDNAAKHGAPPVVVTVTVGTSTWELAVADAGDGLDGAFAPRAFDAFSRGTGGRQDGVGLGLHIVAAFAEGLGGSVAIDPTHAGARFVVTLPLAPAPG